ncbi:hypothetical protein [Solicola sp. PLA-1-18]|uniref:hypothetical protein n=1 Tax=Solicola sp. PLA-1-18 TaxID=3380532 RepID=UPI003B7FE6C6
MDTPQEQPGPGTGARAAVVLAAVVVAAEALALLTFAALDLASVSSGRLALGIGTSLFFVVYGGGQLVAAWGLLRLRSWSRGPVLFTQLIQLGLAWNLRGTGTPLAPFLVVAAVVVLGCLLNRPVLRAFEAADPPDPHTV